jgi:predicted dehydrogenase
VRAFADIPNVRLAGICSRTRSRAEQLAADFQIPAVCGTILELYQRTSADLVVAAVPELEASPVSEACFQFPWTVFLEKPAGYDLANAASIRNAAIEADALDRTFVALNRRFHSSTRTVLEDMKNRTGPRFIVVQDQEDLIAAKASGQPDLVVRNWMFANSIHLIDYFRIFGRGEIVHVNPVLPFTPSAPGATVCMLQYDSGDVGLYQGVWNAPAPWAVTVIHPDRRWELRPLERASFQNRGERQIQPVEALAWDTHFKPGFRAQAEAVVDAALGRTSASVSLDDSFLTMNLIHKMFLPSASPAT